MSGSNVADEIGLILKNDMKVLLDPSIKQFIEIERELKKDRVLVKESQKL